MFPFPEPREDPIVSVGLGVKIRGKMLVFQDTRQFRAYVRNRAEKRRIRNRKSRARAKARRNLFIFRQS